MTITITDVRQANPKYFSPGNKRFFEDIDYRILHSRQHKPYLVTKTYGWINVPHWRIKPIQEHLAIGTLDDRLFDTLNEVKLALNKL